MPVSGMKGAFGWVGQVAQDDLPAAAEYNDNGMTWHKVIAGDLGLMDDQRPYEPEVGGSLLPPGTYKGAYWSGGRLSIRPRLAVADLPANGLVPLLWAYAGTAALLDSTEAITTATLPASVLGTATTVADITGVTGQAIFFPGALGAVQFGREAGDGDNRYLALRKLTPTADGYIGETFYNSKVAGLSVQAASTGPLGVEISFLGGGGDSDQVDQYVLDAFVGEPAAANGWDYATAKPVDTIPMAGGGFVKEGVLSGNESRRVRNFQLNLGGAMTQPQDETVIGQYAPIGYSFLGRQIGIQYQFLWENAELYRRIKLGGITGTTWSVTPYTSPFWSRFPTMAGDYALGFFAQSVHWMSQPLGLRGEGQVVMQVSGVVADVAGAQWALWLAAKDLNVTPTVLDTAATWPS